MLDGYLFGLICVWLSYWSFVEFGWLELDIERVCGVKKREQRERDERTKVNSVRLRLDLRTKMVSFVIFWTSLVFVQTSGVVSETYPFFLAKLMHISNPALFVLTQIVQFTFSFLFFSFPCSPLLIYYFLG